MSLIAKHVTVHEVYDGERLVCRCGSEADAARIVAALRGTEPATADPHDLLAEELALGVRAYNVLNNLGLTSVSQIVAHGRRRILQAKYCGVVSLADIECQLNAVGRNFSGPPAEISPAYERALESARKQDSEWKARMASLGPDVAAHPEHYHSAVTVAG